MKNLEEKLPTLSEYEEAFDGKTLKPWVTQGLNLTSLEDRFKLFIRVAEYAQLNVDPRPNFTSWVKKQHVQIRTAKEYKEFFNGVTGVETSLEYFEGIVGKPMYPLRLLTSFKVVYDSIYPKSLVQWTPIGLLVRDVLESLVDDWEAENIIKQTLESLVLELCNCYKKAVESKDNPNPNDINWRALFDRLVEVGVLATFHRSHFVSNVYTEIADPFKHRKLYLYTDFILEFVPFSLTQHYGVSPASVGYCDPSKGPATDLTFLPTHVEELSHYADGVGRIEETPIYLDFISMFGVLIDDFEPLYKEIEIENHIS